jgi:hypothetical protein
MNSILYYKPQQGAAVQRIKKYRMGKNMENIQEREVNAT